MCVCVWGGGAGTNVHFVPWSGCTISLSSRIRDVAMYDWKTNTGPMFSYFTSGVAVSEVEIDTLTGDHTVSVPVRALAIVYVTVTPSSLARVGSSTTPPLANRTVETWICLFIPSHVWMYAESFALRPTCCLGRRVSEN